jgi:hypothetical protein
VANLDLRSGDEEKPMNFVIIAGRPTVADAHIFLMVSDSPARAHERAADEYRKKHDLPANIHIQTSTAYKTEDESMAKMFVKSLMEKMEKGKAIGLETSSK